MGYPHFIIEFCLAARHGKWPLATRRWQQGMASSSVHSWRGGGWADPLLVVRLDLPSLPPISIACVLVDVTIDVGLDELIGKPANLMTEFLTGRE